jgi:hypothetical protein
LLPNGHPQSNGEHTGDEEGVLHGLSVMRSYA